MKTLLAWFAISFVLSVITVFGLEVAFHRQTNWKAMLGLLFMSTIFAIIGNVVLWLLPIRRAGFGILIGILAAAGAVALHSYFAILCCGGFEENVDIVAGASMVALPNFVAGAYAGYLRSTDQVSARS